MNGELAAPSGTDDKHFSTLRALAARRGYALFRTHPADGPTQFYATRWGLVTELRTLADVERFVDRVGGMA